MTTREEAIAQQVCMTPGPCDDCGRAFQSFMVTDELWRATGLPKFGALLCLGCVERRIGRAVSVQDLPAWSCNRWLQGVVQ